MHLRCFLLVTFALVFHIVADASNHSKLSAFEFSNSHMPNSRQDVRETEDGREQLEAFAELLLAIPGASILPAAFRGLDSGIPGRALFSAEAHPSALRSHANTHQNIIRTGMVNAAETNAIPKRAAIVGAGPAGLLSAIMLARRGWSVSVYDSRQAPPPPDDPQWGAGERSYQLGLNGRGQKALREFEAFECVSRYSASVNGRRTFGEDGKPTDARLKPGEKSYVTRVLQRDRLQSCLVEEVLQYSGNIDINWGVACDGVDMSGEKPVLELCAAKDESCDIYSDISPSLPVDLVIGADGVRSAIRESLVTAVGANTKTVRFHDRNERRYRTLPLHPSAVAGTPTDLSWGARNKTKDLGMDALPTKEGGMVAVILFKPDSPVSREIDALTTGSEARKFFAETLPGLLPYCTDEDLENFVKRPTSRLPSFQLVKGDIAKGLPHGSVALLGDSIKAVKPYFGQGANSALEDVTILSRCLAASGDDPVEAAKAYSRARAEDARALVRTSRSFDMPGKLGTARFLLPLILDIQLSKFFPGIFSPPMLRGLQDERNTFVGLRWKKRRERVLLLMTALAIPKYPLLAVKTIAGLGLGAQLLRILRLRLLSTRL